MSRSNSRSDLRSVLAVTSGGGGGEGCGDGVVGAGGGAGRGAGDAGLLSPHESKQGGDDGQAKA